MTTETTKAFADFAFDASFQQLPGDLVQETKLLILDHVGCGIAGASVAKGRIALELAQKLGGVAEATILGAGGRVASTHAAFANGELMNALDWDPIPHTLPCMIPASLAIAERQRAPGRELILAVALGHEIAGRLAEELPSDLDPRPHGYGSCVFGGVAGAGSLLELTREQMAHAFGIAGFAAPIPAMTRFEGGSSPIPMTKYVSTGWVAQTVVTSTLLADSGYTGDPGILDGDQGFWRLFGGDPERWDPERLTRGLGETWVARKPWYKPYPCEVLIGVAVNRLLEIMREQALGPEEIEAIEFESLPVLATPCHTTTSIETHVDAQFSVPYVLAVAAHGVEVGPAWQDATTIGDPRIQRFMEKVRVGIHPSAREGIGSSEPIESVGHIPCSLQVVARGRRFDADRLEEPPMSEAALIEKFEGNAATALSAPQVERARNLILELEKLEDVSELMSCLVG